MNPRSFVSAWLAASVVTLLLALLWHTVLMESFYATQSAAVAREQPDEIFIVLGYVVLGLLMAIIYPTGYKGGPPLQEGFRFGALMGLLWILPWSLVITGIWNVPLVSVVVDSAWHVIEEGLGGIALAMVYNKTSAAAD